MTTNRTPTSPRAKFAVCDRNVSESNDNVWMIGARIQTFNGIDGGRDWEIPAGAVGFVKDANPHELHVYFPDYGVTANLSRDPTFTTYYYQESLVWVQVHATIGTADRDQTASRVFEFAVPSLSDTEFHVRKDVQRSIATHLTEAHFLYEGLPKPGCDIYHFHDPNTIESVAQQLWHNYRDKDVVLTANFTADNRDRSLRVGHPANVKSLHPPMIGIVIGALEFLLTGAELLRWTSLPGSTPLLDAMDSFPNLRLPDNLFLDI